MVDQLTVDMRISTYNIRGGLGMDGRRSIQRIASVLAGVDAEVFCLQEVHYRLPWSGFRDQPAHLARLLRGQALFQPNFRLGFGGFGNLIVTRRPVLAHAVLCLSNPHERRRLALRWERRGLLEAIIRTSLGDLALGVTHWSLDPRDRLLAVEEIGAHIRGQKRPFILVGDFNATDGTAEIERLRQCTGLIDAGGATGFPTYPSINPRGRIDYIWYSPELRLRHVEIAHTEASDHLPVTAEYFTGNSFSV